MINIRHKRWLIQIIFVLIAIFYGASLFFNKGIFESDELFNYLRIKEVGILLLHGHLPQFNIYTGIPLGIATSTFYPYLFVIPFSFLSLFMSATHFMGILVGILALIGLEVYYLSFLKISKKPIFISFIISMCFWFSTTIMTLVLSNAYDIGTMIADIFLPLIFIGWIKWLQHNKWKMLVVGMLGELYSNEPATLITALLLIILTVLRINQIGKRQVKSGLKAIGTFILCGLFYLLPLCILQLSNKIIYPNEVNINNDVPINFIPKGMSKLLSPFNYDIWDILELITLILLFKYWSYINNLLKQIGIISLILLFMNNNMINNYLVRHTILYWIQSCIRFSSIINFFLSIVLANILYCILKTTKKQFLWKISILIILFVHAFWLLFIPIKINSVNDVKNDLSPKTHILLRNGTSYNNTYMQSNYVIRNFNKNINHSSMILNITPDYSPKQIFNGHNNYKLFLKAYRSNGLNVNYSESNYNITIPIIQYHQQRYEITDNNKKIKGNYSKHFIKIKVHRGNNKIRVTTPIMWYRYIGFVGTLIGISKLCYKKKRK